MCVLVNLSEYVYVSLSTCACVCVCVCDGTIVPGFSGPLSTSSMRMREDLIIYTGKRHKDTGKPSRFFITFCKHSVTFVHVRNQIQKVVDNEPENPGRWHIKHLYI